MNTDIKAIPYSATSVSVLARFIFMFLLYKNKSTNSLSLTFCILNVLSSSMWIYYSYQMNDTPMIVRSGTELVLLVSSAAYIIINKLKNLPVVRAPRPATLISGGVSESQMMRAAYQNSSSSANVIFAASAPTPASA